MIRDARLDEIDHVRALLARAGATPGIPDSAERLAAVVEASHAWLLVAIEDDALAGAVIAAFDGWRGSIYRLAVAPEHRRKGIARALVAESERRLAGAGAPRIGALIIGDEGHVFWRGIGYELDARVTRYVRDL